MKVNQNEFFFKNNNSADSEMYFTNKGNETFVDDKDNPRVNEDGPLVYAKAIRNKKSKSFNNTELGYSYYIKTDPNKKIYDPTILQSVEPKIKKSFLNSTCKSDLVFTPVTQSIFNQYVNFLRTGNSLWLNQAQREIL